VAILPPKMSREDSGQIVELMGEVQKFNKAPAKLALHPRIYCWQLSRQTAKPGQSISVGQFQPPLNAAESFANRNNKPDTIAETDDVCAQAISRQRERLCKTQVSGRRIISKHLRLSE
jgi:hypothetical protein